MKIGTRIVAFALVGVVAATILFFPTPAKASEEGRRNTALALGAATAYFIINKRPVEALVGAGATAYAAKLLQDDINKRHRRERDAASYRSSSSSYRSANSVRRSSGTTRSYSSGSMSTARKQSIESSAYRKGLAAGYKQGYKEGLTEGVRIGANRGRTSSNITSSNTTGSTYSRIRAAMGG